MQQQHYSTYTCSSSSMEFNYLRRSTVYTARLTRHTRLSVRVTVLSKIRFNIVLPVIASRDKHGMSVIAIISDINTAMKISDNQR